MISIPLAKAKNQLYELICRVARGETVAVTRRGKLVAQLVVYTTDAAPSQQSNQVQQTFAGLRQVRSGLTLEGNLKTIARKGLT